MLKSVHVYCTSDKTFNLISTPNYSVKILPHLPQLYLYWTLSSVMRINIFLCGSGSSIEKKQFTDPDPEPDVTLKQIRIQVKNYTIRIRII